MSGNMASVPVVDEGKVSSPASQQSVDSIRNTTDNRQSSSSSPSSPSSSSWQSHAQKWKKRLPGWIIDHCNARDIKILIRCCIAIWVSTIIIFIQPVLENFSQAAFFGAITLYSVPPDGNLFLYTLMSASMLLGMCTAWAWGILTMYCAQAVRSDAEMAAKMESLNQLAAEAAQRTGETVAWEAQGLGNEGYLLDTRVTVVYFVMCSFFIYVVSRLRCINPKFELFQVFSIILLDMFFLGGPSLPEFLPHIAEEVMKPGATGVALGIICSLIFFPESTSFVVLDTLEKLVLLSESSLGWAKEQLAHNPPDMDELKAARAGMVGAYVNTGPLLELLPMDVSRCRWHTEDVNAMQQAVRKLVTASLSLLDLHIATLTLDERIEQVRHLKDKIPTTDKCLEQPGDMSTPGHRQMMESAKLLEALNSPANGLAVDRAISVLQETTADIIGLSSRSMKLVARCIHTVNNNRWFRVPSQSKFDGLARELEETLATLRADKATCVAATTAALLNVHADLFDEEGQMKIIDATDGSPMLLAVVNSMVVEERLLSMVSATEDLLDQTLYLMQNRRTHRIWYPAGFKYAISWVLNTHTKIPTAQQSSSSPTMNDPEKNPNPNIFQSHVKEAHDNLKNIRGYQGARARKRGWFARTLIWTIQWLTNDHGMYCARMVIAGVAAGIPAVVMQTAGFFVREKAIWVVITAQTSVLDYMADFTFSFVSRIFGTLLGGVIGLVTWYMGSGSGTGNPYGMAAACVLATIPLTWIRIFCGMKGMMATILAGATFILVIGYSWDHHHLKQYGLPGMGWVAFWKRTVEVFIGFGIAFIVQIIPTPPSGTKHISKTLANAVRTMSDHYALLLSHWGRAEPNKAIGSVGEKVSLELADALLTLDFPMEMLKMEITSSPFDADTLEKLRDYCQGLNQTIRRLLELVTTMPTEQQNYLVETVGILDDRIIGDVMAVLGLIEQSLRTGCPLPERTPAPLVRIFFESWRNRSPSVILSTDLVRDENYRRYCVGMSTYLQFLSSIDDMVLILKATLGECHVIQQERVPV